MAPTGAGRTALTDRRRARAPALVTPILLDPRVRDVDVLLHPTAMRRSSTTRSRSITIAIALLCGACGGSDATTPTPTTPVPPPPPAVATVTIAAPATSILVPGVSLALAATPRDAQGNVLGGRTVTWSATPASRATIDAAGSLQVRASGEVTITATSEGRTGSLVLTVRDGALVTAAGGAVRSSDSALVLEVPAGALAGETAIAISPVVGSPAHPGLVAGSTWRIESAGATLGTPATVTLRFGSSALPAGVDARTLGVRQLRDGVWSLLPGGMLQASARQVSAELSTFGTVALVGPVTFTRDSGGFESGATEGWTPSGNETLEVSGSAARSGNRGLAVRNRTAAWQGAGRSVLPQVAPGALHSYAVWARLAPGAGTGELGLTMEWRTSGAGSRFEPVSRPTRVSDSAWTLLTGTYALPAAASFARLKVESPNATVAYLLDDFQVTQSEALVQQNIPALHAVMAPHFRLGTAMRSDALATSHADLISRHFRSITPGNELKWESLQRTEGTFDFTAADRLVSFAEQRGLQVRGHTLVWHLQTPDWVFRDSAGQLLTNAPAHQALLRARMEQHIRTVAQHYGDRIATWDVVNEVIDERQPDGLRRSPWYTVLGPDYIAEAFRFARAVLPNATLVINDYLTEVPARREALFALVQRLRADGVPVDGVGHQMHNSLTNPTLANAEAAIVRFAALGIEQEITELDITLYDDLITSWATPPGDRLLQQARRYRDFFDLFRRHAANLRTVTIWGAADDVSWLNFYFTVRQDWPLLFDRQLQAKPAYWAIVDPTYLEVAPLWARTREIDGGS